MWSHEPCHCGAAISGKASSCLLISRAFNSSSCSSAVSRNILSRCHLSVVKCACTELASILFAFVCFPKHSGTSKQVCFFFNLISRIDKKISGVIHHTHNRPFGHWGCGVGIGIGGVCSFLSRFLAFFVTFRPCLRQPSTTETALMAQIDHLSLYDRQPLDALQR
jgi:hypothetical protein